MIVRRLWPTTPSFESSLTEIDRMRREMERLFEGVTGATSREAHAGLYPLVNLSQSGDHFFVRAEMPGIKPSDLEITTTRSVLTIAGRRETAAEVEPASYHRRERLAGQFRRSVTLPGDFDAARVEAHYTDGVLTVKLPKTEEAKPRQITVKAS
jgi:HSP20 family protein